MQKILNVDQFLEQKPNANIDDLFVHYKSDLESIIIACVKLKIPFTEFLPNYNSPYSAAEIQDKIEEYADTEYLPYFLRKNVNTALILFDYNLSNLANDFINVLVKDPEYIYQVQQEGVFSNGNFLIKFPNISLSPDILEIINDMIDQGSEKCVAEDDQVFYDFLKLNKFLNHREDSKEEVLKLITNYKSEDERVPVDFLFFAKLDGTANKVFFYQYYESLNKVINQQLEYVSGKTIAKTIKNKVLDLVKGESKDGLSKIPFEANIVMDIAELKAKGLLFGLELIIDVYKEFPSTIAVGHRRSFDDSGLQNVEEWFINSVKDMFTHFKTKNNLEMIEVNEETIRSEYLKFISRYYSSWEVLKSEYVQYVNDSLDMDTIVFMSVTSYFLNQSIKIKDFKKFM